jgi:hypothetical protein
LGLPVLGVTEGKARAAEFLRDGKNLDLMEAADAWEDFRIGVLSLRNMLLSLPCPFCNSPHERMLTADEAEEKY